MKRRAISVFVLCGFLATTAAAQVVVPAGVVAGPGTVYWGRLTSVASLAGQAATVHLEGVLAEYPVRVHLLFAFCQSGGPFVITGGAPYSRTMPAGANFQDAFWYPGFLATIPGNTLTVTAGPCGPNDKVFLHVAYSP